MSKGLLNTKAWTYYTKTAHNADGVFVLKALRKALMYNAGGAAIITGKNVAKRKGWLS